MENNPNVEDHNDAVTVNIALDSSRWGFAPGLVPREQNLHLPGYSIEKVLIWIDKEGKLFHIKESCFVSGELTDHIIKEIDPSTLGQDINIAIITLSADDKKVSSLFQILGQLNIPNNLNTK